MSRDSAKNVNWEPDVSKAFDIAKKPGKGIQAEIDKIARTPGTSPLDIVGPLHDIQKNIVGHGSQ